MVYFNYFIIAVAVFFAFGWTLGVLTRPTPRGTLGVVISWWICVLYALYYNHFAFHLIWIMPAIVYANSVYLLGVVRSGIQTGEIDQNFIIGKMLHFSLVHISLCTFLPYFLISL